MPGAPIAADDPTLTGKKRNARLWANPKVHKETVTSLANSVRVLSELWEGAWVVGNGDADVKKGDIEALSPHALQKVYRTEKGFVPSMSLAAMARSGKFEPPPGVAPGPLSAAANTGRGRKACGASTA